jgi:hypothetical protein
MTKATAGLLGLVLAATACRHEPPADAPAPRGPLVAVPVARPPAAAPSPADEALVAETPEANPTSETVTIKLVADPQRKARVFWGRKDLGLAPLELQRPRGSGPLDLIVVTPGMLTLHTRVFTDRDDKLALHLYGESDGPTILGYRGDDDPANKPPKNAADAAKRKSVRASP